MGMRVGCARVGSAGQNLAVPTLPAKHKRTILRFVSYEQNPWPHISLY